MTDAELDDLVMSVQTDPDIRGWVGVLVGNLADDYRRCRGMLKALGVDPDADTPAFPAAAPILSTDAAAVSLAEGAD